MTRYGLVESAVGARNVPNGRQESMMTILAIVNASKEGQIESKMMKSRQMEEIREARRKEMEVRQEQKQAKLVYLT